MFSSLKIKLAFSHLGVIFGTASVLAFITYFTGIKIYEEATFDNLHKSSANSAITIHNFITNKQNLLKRISESRETELFAKKFQDVALAAYFSNFKHEFNTLSYITPAGSEEVRVDNGNINHTLRDLSNTIQFKQAQEEPGEVFLSVAPSNHDHPLATLVFTIAKQHYFDERLIHVLQAEMPIATLAEHLVSFSQFRADYLILADSKNTVLAHPQQRLIQTKLHLPDQKQGFGTAEQLGERGLYSSLELGSPDWKLIHVLPLDKYVVDPIKYAKLVFAVFICVLLVGFLVVIFIARKINAPITDLTKAVKLITKGKKIQLLHPYQIEELDNLVEAFNAMTLELSKTTISKDYLNSIVNSLKECLVVISLNGTIESANQMTFDLVGYNEEQLVGQPISKIFPEDFDIYSYLFDDENQEELETSFITSGQEEIPINFYRSHLRNEHGSAQGIVCLALDIRKRKKAEADKEALKTQLHKAQRLETVGTLASGIAHDFNNILTIIIGYSQILNYTTKDEDSKKSLQHILSASNRAKDLVQQLLDFSRQRSHPKMEISLVPIIKEIIKMLRSSTPASIEILHQLGQDCSPIISDPSQIQQIIMNLCSNAIHAMGTHGTLTIKLDDEHVTKLNASQYINVPQGKYAKLMICDTGHGIKESDLDRIFDPFFTTKGVNEGTGLGLSVVHGIIQGMEGHIFVTSKVDIGTTFTLLFPALTKNDGEEGHATFAAFPKFLKGNGENILFIDDEAALTKLGKMNLEHLNYKVTAMTSAIEALDFFKMNPTMFDLLVTDFSMPKMQGDELILEIKKIKRDLPTILCTGYHAELVKTEKIEAPHRTIKKPYTTEELATAVYELLGRKAP